MCLRRITYSHLKCFEVDKVYCYVDGDKRKIIDETGSKYHVGRDPHFTGNWVEDYSCCSNKSKELVVGNYATIRPEWYGNYSEDTRYLIFKVTESWETDNRDKILTLHHDKTNTTKRILAHHLKRHYKQDHDDVVDAHEYPTNLSVTGYTRSSSKQWKAVISNIDINKVLYGGLPLRQVWLTGTFEFNKEEKKMNIPKIDVTNPTLLNGKDIDTISMEDFIKEINKHRDALTYYKELLKSGGGKSPKIEGIIDGIEKGMATLYELMEKSKYEA